MPGWGRLVAGAVIGAAGAIYATNEDLRKRLPGAARDLPETVRRRLQTAAAAAREASALRRAEILKELEAREADHLSRRSLGTPAGAAPGLPAVEEGPSKDPSTVVRRASIERAEPAAPVEE